MVDHGRVIARGDARQLKREVGGDQLELVPVDAADVPRAAEILERVAGARASVDPAVRRITAPTVAGVEALGEVAGELQAAGIEVEDLGLRQPTLEDVFLTLTGAPLAADGGRNGTGQPEEALR